MAKFYEFYFNIIKRVRILQLPAVLHQRLQYFVRLMKYRSNTDVIHCKNGILSPSNHVILGIFETRKSVVMYVYYFTKTCWFCIDFSWLQLAWRASRVSWIVLVVKMNLFFLDLRLFFIRYCWS